MWLLTTDRAELHEFVSPEAVPGAYAILSHVWDKDEQTFQDTRRFQDECAASKLNPRDRASPKIRGACVLAEEHGYDWLWIDAPCIDKSSSAEVSEAINSMYRYYSLAEVCYAYLKDVPHGDIFDRDQPTSAAFSKSEWHQRGWTLQELIASRIVIFLSRDWTLLGTKAELADLVEGVTQIPASLLRLKTQLAHFSIAQRMSWAANRQTTRKEDRAYSLLGIFGIQMPPLYGEGVQAFYRLQEEIMKRFPDTSLFAWRPTRPVSTSTDLTLPTLYHHEHSDDTYLLASSPLAFRHSSRIRFSPRAVTARLGGLHYNTTAELDAEGCSIPTFSVTPHGVLAHIPVIQLPEYMIAMLFWRSDQDDHLGLRLNPCNGSVSSSRLLYDAHPGEDRIVPLGVDKDGYFTVDGQPFDVVWKKLYIAHRPPPDTPTPDAATSLYMPLNLGVLIPFRIPGKNIQALHASTRLRLVSVSEMSLPWTGSPPITLTFQPDEDDAVLPGIDLHLGRCTRSVPGRARSGHHWAQLVFHPSHADRKDTSLHGDGDEDHMCSEDHIDDWPGSTKVFRPLRWQPAETSVLPPSPSPSIKLCFTPCPLNPGTTLVLEIIPGDGLDTMAPSGESERRGFRSLLAWAAGMIWRAFGWENASS
ncbi:hypothetical protein V8D89_003825 [Ganoderma adspersum]